MTTPLETALPLIKNATSATIDSCTKSGFQRWQERKDLAANISEITSRLYTAAARHLDIRLISDRNGLNIELLEAFDGALMAQKQFAYRLPKYLQARLDQFIEATYQNIAYWKRRWEIAQDPGNCLPMTRNEATRELPNIDQIRGKANAAYDELQKALRRYIRRRFYWLPF